MSKGKGSFDDGRLERAFSISGNFVVILWFFRDFFSCSIGFSGIRGKTCDFFKKGF
ncbi:MAG: hypothetical protein KJ955_08170 [Nanoarchaeota archaeon]|nr:hypothetical protein [Nanoarchaeota archaeon]